MVGKCAKIAANAQYSTQHHPRWLSAVSHQFAHQVPHGLPSRRHNSITTTLIEMAASAISMMRQKSSRPGPKQCHFLPSFVQSVQLAMLALAFVSNVSSATSIDVNYSLGAYLIELDTFRPIRGTSRCLCGCCFLFAAPQTSSKHH